MSHVEKTSIAREYAFYVVACLPMVLLLVNCVRDIYCDVQMIRKAALRTEISRLRSQAVRRTGQLEFVVALQPPPVDLKSLGSEAWLRDEWKKFGAPAGHDLYAAIVDSGGTIVLHSDPSLAGRPLGRDWYEHTVPEAGDDVVRVEASTLSRGAEAYDVRVPLVVRGQEIGEYHEGMDAAWFDREVVALQREALAGWSWVLLLAVAVDAAAAFALYRIAAWQARLGKLALEGRRDWTTQLAQIASGLAHEIRNPLHALRLNLHALDRAIAGKTQLSKEDQLATLRESDLEIMQLESLLRDLIRFASLDTGNYMDLNIVGEVEATLNLMRADMQRKGIDVRTHLDDQPVVVWTDPARLRQVLVNLLTFAQNNAGAKGWIDIHVKRRGRLAEIVVADSGPTLPEGQLRRVFEPFQAPRETGSGLGLALVKSYASQAGGSVSCEVGVPSGNRFRVVLPDTVPRGKS